VNEEGKEEEKNEVNAKFRGDDGYGLRGKGDSLVEGNEEEGDDNGGGKSTDDAPCFGAVAFRDEHDEDDEESGEEKRDDDLEKQWVHGDEGIG